MPEIPTAFFKMFILKNHFGGFLLHRRCAPYPDGLGSADFSSARFSGLEEVDILPALLSQRERPWAIGPLSNGDSYGVFQAIHLEESLRWVPASSEMHALPLRAWHG